VYNIGQGESWMSKKTKCQKIHFRKRLLQRHGISVTATQYEQMIQMIQNGQVKPTGSINNRLGQFEIEIEGKTIQIVYDRRRKTLVTALPDGTKPIRENPNWQPNKEKKLVKTSSQTNKPINQPVHTNKKKKRSITRPVATLTESLGLVLKDVVKDLQVEETTI
jgi:hypothetical protein